MAKKAKKETLTPEERLAQALVPEDEQPYNVPDNWVWTRLGLFVNLLTGYPFDSSCYTDKNGDGLMPLIRIRDVVRGYTLTNTSQNCDSMYIIKRGDILVGMDGDFNLGVWNSDDAFLNQRVCRISSKNQFLLQDYFKFYLPRPLKEIQDKTPSVTVKHISAKQINLIPIPLPPLAEQKRIVDRVESLFAKLVAAKELAQTALDSFETRKTAILHKAFTGELTVKWRAEHGVGLETWEEKTLEDVCSSVYDGDHMPPPKSESGIPFLVISDVNQGHLTFNNKRFVPQNYYNNLSITRKPQKGDVLYTIVGSYGIPALIDVDKEFCFQRHIALLRPKEINSKCLWYLLQTEDMYQQATSIATGTAQLTVPIKGLRKMRFSMPSSLEQQEIARILDCLFEKEQRAKELCDVIDKIDLMKKAILASAFRGELGTNEPMEESALELLRTCVEA